MISHTQRCVRHASWRDVNETPGDLNFGFVWLYRLRFGLPDQKSMKNYDKHHQINNNTNNNNNDDDDDSNNNKLKLNCACKITISQFKVLIQII